MTGIPIGGSRFDRRYGNSGLTINVGNIGNVWENRSKLGDILPKSSNLVVAEKQQGLSVKLWIFYMLFVISMAIYTWYVNDGPWLFIGTTIGALFAVLGTYVGMTKYWESSSAV